jgi:hypothetical protein
MPGSKGILSDEEIWSNGLFIRHLPPAGRGDPPSFLANKALEAVGQRGGSHAWTIDGEAVVPPFAKGRRVESGLPGV